MKQEKAKFPHVEVTLNGESAFEIMNKTLAAMRRAGVPKADRDAAFGEFASDCRAPVLNVVKRFVTVRPHVKP